MAKPTNFDKSQHHGVNELSIKAGTSATTVSRKLRQGKTPEQIIEEALDWKNREKPAPKSKGSGESYSAAQQRKEIALADLRELELSVKRGELVPLGEINAWVSGMILRSRDILGRIAPELRDRLAKETNPIRIQELIDAEVRRALTQLSVFRIDESL